MSHGNPNQTHCPECALGTFARNHYFTGKLLVERDFTDEQRYHSDKLRHHHQRLHGWGVVCGLKVKQHPDPACQDRYVIVEPGTAIDCCGHEILVREEVRFPFAEAAALQALRKKNDTHPHALQVCVRYKECPTEEIPVLFDECGCDETRCAPNRILESYELDVQVVDQPPAIDDPLKVRLERKHTISIAHSARVALHEATHRLYVMNSASLGVIYAVSTDNQAIVGTPQALSSKGLALAVSNDGKHLYAAVKGANPTDPLRMLVFDVAKLGQADAQIRDLSVAGTAGNDVFLAVTPDDRLVALFAAHKIVIWGTDINNPAGSPAAPEVPLPWNLSDLVLSTDGMRAYTTDATNHKVRVINIKTISHSDTDDIIVSDPGSSTPSWKPSTIAIAHSTAGDTLVVGDHDHKRLYLISPTDTNSPESEALTNSPVALAASPGGNWICALEKDGGSPALWFVESVSVSRVQLGRPNPLGPLVPVGENATQLSLSESGRTLFVPYAGDPQVADSGGVALLDVSETDCGELLWKPLEGCPSCETANCVVLATINNYHLRDQIEDQTDPPADPVADLNAKIARIDNRTGRRSLPSTQVLTEVVECILEHGAGKQGPQGKQGIRGPRGKEGIQGKPGAGLIPFKLLPHIIAINWPHNERIEHDRDLWQSIQNMGGLVIAFDKPVKPETISQPLNLGNQFGIPIFEVLWRPLVQPPTSVECFYSLRSKVVPVQVIAEDGGILKDCRKKILRVENPGPAGATGAQFLFSPSLLDVGEHRVIVRGDFILGAVQIPPRYRKSWQPDPWYPALDADHLGPGLPERCPTGDGVEGGTFESWFTVVP
jgi:DNA-binding beta-propeller fold protein YncE